MMLLNPGSDDSTEIVAAKKNDRNKELTPHSLLVILIAWLLLWDAERGKMRWIPKREDRTFSLFLELS